jgi:hypothetical protein
MLQLAEIEDDRLKGWNSEDPGEHYEAAGPIAQGLKAR